MCLKRNEKKMNREMTKVSQSRILENTTKVEKMTKKATCRKFTLKFKYVFFGQQKSWFSTSDQRFLDTFSKIDTRNLCQVGKTAMMFRAPVLFSRKNLLVSCFLLVVNSKLSAVFLSCYPKSYECETFALAQQKNTRLEIFQKCNLMKA